MAKSVVISVRLPEELKKESEALYEDMGLSLSAAITMFLRKSVKEQGIPFDVNRSMRYALQPDDPIVVIMEELLARDKSGRAPFELTGKGVSRE